MAMLPLYPGMDLLKSLSEKAQAAAPPSECPKATKEPSGGIALGNTSRASIIIFARSLACAALSSQAWPIRRPLGSLST
jgi:hypothetical protein